MHLLNLIFNKHMYRTFADTLCIIKDVLYIYIYSMANSYCYFIYDGCISQNIFNESNIEYANEYSKDGHRK